MSCARYAVPREAGSVAVMDVMHESARGEEPAVWNDDETGNPEGVKPPGRAWAAESPSRLEGVDPEVLLEALGADEDGAGEPEEFSAESVNDGEAEDGDEGGPGRRAPQRLSVRGLPAEQQFQLAEALDRVRRGEAGDVMEALEEMKGGPRTSEVRDRRSDEKEEVGESSGEGDAVGTREMKDRIGTLRGQRREAIEDFDRAAEARLTEEIEDLQRDLWRAEQAAQGQVQEEAQGQSYQEHYHAAVDAMEEKYPETRDEGSAFFQILDNKIAAAQARQDPALADPGFILHFADEVAGMLGGRAARPQGRVPVGSALAPGYQTAARPGREQLTRMIREMPLEELERLVCTE